MIFACGPTTPPGSGGAGGTGGSGGDAGKLPCSVDAILKAKCQLCHGAVPAGAPMSLVTYADTQAVRPSGQKTWEVMQSRINAGTMPPPGYDQLTAYEKATLDTWFSQGAPQGTQTADCGNVPPPEQQAGVQYLPCTPKYYFRANAGGNTPFAVPAGTKDRYVSFSFPNPFAKGEQAVAWAPVIDNPKVIHHYILYGGPAQTFVAGWAPGGVNAVMAPDLGLVLDYPSFTLQVHYNNHADGAVDTTDSSGVAFCTTTTPREHPTGVITTGKIMFSIPPGAQNMPVNGSCSKLSATGEPITIVAGSAHMHKHGVGFHTELYDSTGASKGVVTDVPMGTWNFDQQHPQPLRERLVVNPGDKMKTTCYYSNPGATAVSFGEGTEDEMCFDFFSVYPVTSANRFCMDSL